MTQIKFAFIKIGNEFIPSHISEIKKGDIYYLVTDGKPSNYFTATEDAFLQSPDNWDVIGLPRLLDK